MQEFVIHFIDGVKLMILSVIIVDDESYVRVSVKNRVDWAAYHAQIVGEASSGKQALTLIEKLHPDIVITDIRMPDMNGLELIRLAKIQNQSLNFIILSGYGDFTYAKQALQLGVHDFIEKPVNEIELGNALCSVAAKLKTHRDNKTTDRQPVNKVLRNHCLRQTLLHSVKIHTLEDSVFSFPSYILAMIQLLNVKSFGDPNYLCEAVEGFFNSQDHNLSCYVFPIDVSQRLFSVLFGIHSSLNNNLPIISKKLRYLLQTVLDDPSSDMYIAYLETTTLDGAYHKILYTMKCRLLEPKKKDLFSSEIENKTVIHASIRDSIKILRHSIADMKEYQFHQKLTQIIPDDGQGLTVIMLEWIIQEIRSELSLLLSEKHFSIYSPTLDEIAQSGYLLHFSSLSTLRNQLYTVTKIIFEAAKTDDDSNADIVSQIIDYVDENYNTSLTLSSIGARFYMNPIYLSSLFKRKTGHNLFQYIENIRMNRAKHLLANSDLILKEVALFVGYNDTNYFGKVFRKNVGISPTEFRIHHGIKP